MKPSALAVAAMLLAGCGSSTSAESVPLTPISTVLANRSTYDGALVRVQGPAIVRFEASFVCPSVETLDASGSTSKCLWLVPGETDGKEPYDLGPLDGKIVEVVGRFDAKQFGHMGAYGGTVAVTSSQVEASHGMRDTPPPPPPPGAPYCVRDDPGQWLAGASQRFAVVGAPAVGDAWRGTAVLTRRGEEFHVVRVVAGTRLEGRAEMQTCGGGEYRRFRVVYEDGSEGICHATSNGNNDLRFACDVSIRGGKRGMEAWFEPPFPSNVD